MFLKVKQWLKPQKAMRYLLFYWTDGEGTGGWGDCKGTFPDRQSAIREGQIANHLPSSMIKPICFEVVNLDTCQIVANNDTHPHPAEPILIEDADVRD